MNPFCATYADKRVKGRCPTCYGYVKRHGRERGAPVPARMSPPPLPIAPRKTGPCANPICTYVGTIWAKDRCRACYDHLADNGEDRPIHKVHGITPLTRYKSPDDLDPHECADCGGPRVRLTTPLGKFKTLCDNCAQPRLYRR